MGIVTGLEVQKRNKKRVNVFVDGEFAFGASLDDAARLKKGQEISDATIQLLRDQDAINHAMDAAARLLAARPRSVQEIRKRLQEKDTPPTVIDSALEKLSAMGYLDDHAFAAFWVQERNTHKPISPRALRYELRQKGVEDPIIAEVLGDIDPEESAYRAVKDRATRLRGYTRREFRDKLSGILGRRGFNYSVTRSVLRRLMDEIESDHPSFFASEGNPNEDEVLDTLD
jgi:regulatory protein